MDKLIEKLYWKIERVNNWEKYIFLPIWIPGSWKSTLWEVLKEKWVLVIDNDILRKELNLQPDSKEVFSYSENIAKIILNKWYSVYIDSNNNVRNFRNIWHKIAKDFNCKIIIFDISFDIKTIKERLRLRQSETNNNLNRRDFLLHFDVIEKMILEYDKPWNDENSIELDWRKDFKNQLSIYNLFF